MNFGMTTGIGIGVHMGCGPRGVFSPAALANLTLWFDMSDATTLFDATSGGSLSAANAVVKRVEDKSANGWHVTQATPGAEPIRKAAFVNGRDCLQFDGGDYLFRNSGQLPLIERTVFVVARETTSRDYAGLFVALPTAGLPDFEQANAFELDTGLSGQQIIISGGTGGSYTMNAGTTSPSPLAVYAERKTAGSGQLWINNTVAATENSFTEFSALSAGGFAFGARYLSAFNLTYGLIGEICEVLYFSRRLNDTEMSAMNTYLANKWL